MGVDARRKLYYINYMYVLYCMGKCRRNKLRQHCIHVQNPVLTSWTELYKFRKERSLILLCFNDIVKTIWFEILAVMYVHLSISKSGPSLVSLVIIATVPKICFPTRTTNYATSVYCTNTNAWNFILSLDKAIHFVSEPRG